MGGKQYQKTKMEMYGTCPREKKIYFFRNLSGELLIASFRCVLKNRLKCYLSNPSMKHYLVSVNHGTYTRFYIMSVILVFLSKFFFCSFIIHNFIKLVCRLLVLSRLTYLAGGGQLMGGNT